MCIVKYINITEPSWKSLTSFLFTIKKGEVENMSRPKEPQVVLLRRKLLQLEMKLNRIKQLKHPLVWDTIEQRLLILKIAEIRRKIQAEIINLS